MNYTKHFGAITREHGALNLSSRQFQRMMNIVHLEGVILGLKKVKETYKNTNQYYKYDTIILKHDVQLTDLTGNLNPDLLMEEMMRFED